MSKLRQTAAGGGKLLRYFPHIVKYEDKIATSAPLAPTASRNNLLAGGLARGAVFSLLVLAVAPFVLTTPVYATNDNTIDIAVDSDATMERSGDLYKATTSVTVGTDKPYGFSLTMQASTPDLINVADPTHKISAPQSAAPTSLSANQWGYALDKSATTFSAVPADAQATPASAQSGAQPATQPAISVVPAVIADVTKAKPAGCKNVKFCTKRVTFAANVAPDRLAAGAYSTAITYTATAKPGSGSESWSIPVVDPTVCKSGDPNNDCQVDIDANMIPVKYTGNTANAEWISLANPENSSNQGNWYNYNNKRWANAVTVKDPSKYKNQTKVIDQSDILGFWVYIPRYAYEVMRRDTTDAPVSAQNFTIHFEKATDPKRYPAESNYSGRNMDYRTTCGLNRDYIKGQPSEQGTWATHPAFTFGTKELNGIWFAKFETTGTTAHPTVLPNEAHISGYYGGMDRQVGNFYSLSKTIGVYDPNNVGGSGFTTTQNNHHLAKFSSHMVNNNDWGAATYLSASKYGAGYNGVQINANGAEQVNSYGTTGCGPQANGNISRYNYSSTLGTPQACGNTRAYNATLGQLASTTNNPTGIYDMSGGGYEYVAASYSDNLNNSNTNEHFGSNAAHPPYVNTYNFKNFNSCTYQTCGGQALYETHNGSSSTSHNMWLNQTAYFIEQDSVPYHWFSRGGRYDFGSHAGLFCVNDNSGGADGNGAFRVALAPTV